MLLNKNHTFSFVFTSIIICKINLAIIIAATTTTTTTYDDDAMYMHNECTRRTMEGRPSQQNPLETRRSRSYYYYCYLQRRVDYCYICRLIMANFTSVKIAQLFLFLLLFFQNQSCEITIEVFFLFRTVLAA